MKMFARWGLTALLAASAALPAQEFVVRAYRQADGLKNLAVRSLALGCDGYLWAGTEGGVFRFLGSGFEHFGADEGIVESGIQEIVTDKACNVWVGTTHNVYRFDSGHFVPAMARPIHIRSAHGMAAEDEYNLLVVEGGTLFRLRHGEHGEGVSYLPVLDSAAGKALPGLFKVSSVSVAGVSNGNARVWVGAGDGLYSWADASQNGVARVAVKAYAISAWNKRAGLPDDHWESVVVDHAGTVWAEGWSHMAALPAGASRFADHSLSVAAQGNFFLRSRLAVDRGGRVLAATDEGIARWEDDHWRLIGRQNGLPRNDQIGAMQFDASGDLWLGSYGDGLYNWTGYGDWEGWGDDQHLPSAIIWAIDASHPERVIAGTDKGPAWVDAATGASGSLVTTGALVKHGVWTPGMIVAMGHERDGSVWAATNPGSVLRIDAKTGNTTQTARLPASIVSGFEDAAGRLFLGTVHGLYMREAGKTTSVPQRVTAADGLLPQSEWVSAGCQSPNGVNWFLGGNEIVGEQNGLWRKPALDGLPGLATGHLIALACAPDGTLWVTGPRIGTWRLTEQGSRMKAWQLKPPAELRNIDSYSIIADRRGWIWLGTGQGLLAWNGSTWRHLTQESGMLWNDVDEWGLSEGADGSLWVGTSGGLAHLIHPEHVFEPVPLDVSITGAERGNANLDADEQVRLPWSTLPLRFQLSSPLVRNRSELVFKYQLEGSHSGWIESRDGLAVLSGVSPGNYTFMAMASNAGLKADSAVIKVRMTIRPPWWRKVWVWLLAAAALLLLLVAVIRLYGRHLRARSRQLEALVKQRTVELEDSREQLRILAMYDGLTGMLNRSAILSELAQQIDRARRSGKTMIVALADVDHFKSVNDAYGHLVGDEALRRFAGALRESIRAYDSVGRYGGEEFLVVLAEIPWELAETRMTHLHEAVSNLQIRVRDAEIHINCSMGATVFDPMGESADAEELLAVADQALYTAKAEGRNRVVFRKVSAEDCDGFEQSDEQALA